jgi:hypothetical protein
MFTFIASVNDWAKRIVDAIAGWLGPRDDTEKNAALVPVYVRVDDRPVPRRPR